MRRTRLRAAGIEDQLEPAPGMRRSYPRPTPIVLRTRSGPLARLPSLGAAVLGTVASGRAALGRDRPASRGAREPLPGARARDAAARVGSRVAARSGIDRDQAGLMAMLALALLLVLAVGGAGADRRDRPPVAGGTAVPASSPSSPVRTSPSATRPPASGSPVRSTSPRPGATATAAGTGSPRPDPSPSPRPRTYVVRAGDTLARIARRFGTTVRVLMELNGIADPRSIRPGQVLKLP